MKIGFTGTQVGINNRQRSLLIKILKEKKPSACIHGDCIGADKDFHLISKNLDLLVEICPPKDKKKRAFCNGDVIHEADDYLARNRKIVDACDLLIAAPKGNDEELRSGTWATVRYARKVKKPIIVLLRNEEEKK